LRILIVYYIIPVGLYSNEEPKEAEREERKREHLSK